MQFIDIKAIHKHSASQIDTAVAKVFEHGRYINGPEVYELEATLGRFLGGADTPLHSVAVASGTMALEIALRALGIGAGDEVITTPFTWISTAETIAEKHGLKIIEDAAQSHYRTGQGGHTR